MKTPLIALFVPILIAVLLLSCSKSTEPQTCANPVFSQTSGTYNNELFVTISCETPGAVIRYTTNGSDPTESSNQYNSGITINTTTTLKAKAFKSGWNPSTTTSASYTIIQTVATPVFSPEGGTYYPSVNVSISCGTPGATTRYTTNGSNPTSSSSVYSSPISITSTTTLKAKAFKSGWNESAIANSSYSIEMPQTVATPTFNPSGGTYNSTQSVTMSCNTPGATIRYTTNGSTPTSSSPLYQNPVTISATTTLKARAFRSGWYDSEIASAVYTIDTTPTVATPTFNPPGGSYSSPQNVTISCSTSGATIRYTTNGSNPTSLSPTYTSPISVTSSTPIKAKAFKSGWNDSQVASASFTITGLYEVASLTNIGTARKVVKYQNYLYVVSDYAGINIIDVSNESNPYLVSTHSSFIVTGGVAINGNKLYVSDTYDKKITVYSLYSDPTSPMWIGSITTQDGAYGIFIHNNYLYAASGSAGLLIYSISSSGNLTLRGSYNTPGFAMNVYVQDNIAYVADGEGGLRIINVSDPYNPYEIAFHGTPGYPRDVVLIGSVAYVSSSGLAVVDVSVLPPILADYYGTYGSSMRVKKDVNANSVVYMADGTDGIRRFNVSNIQSIVQTNVFDTPGAAWDVLLEGDYIYVADSGGGLRILRFR